MMPIPETAILHHEQAAGIDFLVRPGEGDPVVLLHGIGGRAASFAPVMAAWRGNARVLAWDAPGYGGSALLPDETPSPAAYAARLAESVATLGLGRIHVVGQSLGALFAAAFGAAFPERVRTLALICPAHGYDQPRGRLTEALDRRVADAGAEGMTAFAAARAHRLVHRPEAKPGVVSAVQDAMGSVSLAGHGAAVHALAQGNLIRDCAAVTSPIHVLAGADDQITPLSGSLKLYDALRSRSDAASIPDQLSVFGDAGHALIGEHPIAVALALGSTLEHGR